MLVKALNTAKCKGTVCGNAAFDFINIRYYCESCEQFYCHKCSARSWVYENKAATVKERPVTRCYTCDNKINKFESELQDAIQKHEFYTVQNVLNEITEKRIDIDV